MAHRETVETVDLAGIILAILTANRRDNGCNAEFLANIENELKQGRIAYTHEELSQAINELVIGGSVKILIDKFTPPHLGAYSIRLLFQKSV